MTTKVFILYPEDGSHASAVEIYATGDALGHTGDRRPALLARLKPGESTHQYVHSGQQLLVCEKFE